MSPLKAEHIVAIVVGVVIAIVGLTGLINWLTMPEKDRTDIKNLGTRMTSRARDGVRDVRDTMIGA